MINHTVATVLLLTSSWHCC